MSTPQGKGSFGCCPPKGPGRMPHTCPPPPLYFCVVEGRVEVVHGVPLPCSCPDADQGPLLLNVLATADLPMSKWSVCTQWAVGALWYWGSGAEHEGEGAAWYSLSPAVCVRSVVSNHTSRARACTANLLRFCFLHTASVCVCVCVFVSQ